MEILVKKRNGECEKFDATKITRVIDWAVDGVFGINANDIEINAKISLRENITTDEIHQCVVESAARFISEKTPQYQIVASRLLNYKLRKQVWGGKNPPKLLNFITKMVELGVYDEILLTKYSHDEINKLDESIDHDRDLLLTYAGIKQLCDKYLCKNRSTSVFYETPQFAYMCAGMFAFHRYSGKNRLDYIKKFYNYTSKHKINLPTPVIAGLRTPFRSFASCCLVKVADTRDSLFATNSAVSDATCKRYGIGLNFSNIRAVDAPIRNGEATHPGVIPFLKGYQDWIKACYQGGLRDGGGTINFPIFHYEVEDIIQLKNNAGTDDNRVRKLDYSIGFSKIFYERYIKNENITLLSYHEVPEVFDSFGSNEFDKLYLAAEENSELKFKKVINIRDLFQLYAKERIETGRIYVCNVDHANSHGPWQEIVQTQNLCLEVLHPLTAMSKRDDENAEIGVCILSAINMLEVNSDAELEKICDVIIRFLDEIVDIQDYFDIAARNFAQKRRSLGVGITNYAAWLVKNGTSYSDEKARIITDEFFEKMQFFLLKASNTLAKEVGQCEKFGKTKYSLGILPIDTYKKDVDKLVLRAYSMDWEALRNDIKEYGLRHSTVTAIMPCESSSVIASSTNGVEPPRGPISYKRSKSGTLPVLVPNVSAWKNKYSYAWTFENKHIIELNAIMQKWIDMGISTNLYYKKNKDNGEKTSYFDVISDMVYAYKLGLVSLYYANTKGDVDDTVVVSEEQEEVEDCAGGACKL